MLNAIRRASRFVRAAKLLARDDKELILTTKPEDQENYVRILSHTAEVYPLSIAPVTVVRADRSTLTDLVSAWAGKPATLSNDLNLDDLLIEPSYQRSGNETPWNLDLVGQPNGVERSDGEGAIVAVLDTGIDYTHPEISSRFGSNKGVNIIDSGPPMDRRGHGTHVAGTIAGKDVGMAPRATLYAVKVLDDYGRGYDGGIIRGIEWSVINKANVINMSLGGTYYSRAFQTIVTAAHQEGLTIVAAAGNTGREEPHYPASYDNVISVAAVDKNKQRASFSTKHKTVDLSGPGVDVRSLAPGGGYKVASGTSMATPHVAGACAMLIAKGVKDPEAALKRTAEERGERIEYGAGLIRVDRALASEENLMTKTISYANMIRRYLI